MAFIIIIILNTYCDYVYYYHNASCKRRVKILDLQGVYRAYAERAHGAPTTRPQRTHEALEDPTALPQRPYSALSNTLHMQTPNRGVCFDHVQNTWRSRRLHSVFTAFQWRSRRLHSVFTAFQWRCWRLHSVFTAFQWRCWRLHSVFTAFQRRCWRLHSVFTAFQWRCWRLHSVFTAFQRRCWRLHSVFTAFQRRCWRLHSMHLGELKFLRHIQAKIFLCFDMISVFYCVELGQTFFIFRLSRIPTAFVQEMEKKFYIFLLPTV